MASNPSAAIPATLVAPGALVFGCGGWPGIGQEKRKRRRGQMSIKYRYNYLDDFLATNPLHVDGQGDYGGGALFPVKGREIDATVLFSDISGFSKRTLDLSP